jgi:hypothetical protein
VLTCKRKGLDPALMLPDQQLLIIVFQQVFVKVITLHVQCVPLH